MHVHGTTTLKGPHGGQMATQMEAGRRGPLAVPRQCSALQRSSLFKSSRFFGGGVQARTGQALQSAMHGFLRLD